MTEKQQEEIDLLKELIADSSIANDEREIYQKALTTLLSRSGSEEPKVAKKMMPKKEKATPKTKATKKPKATKPAQLPSDVEAMKKQIKERTGKTESECEDIIAQYRMLRNKAKVNGAKRIAKLKNSDDLIAGTNVITPVAQIEKDAEIVKAKIEKQVEQIENKAERQVVTKDKTKDEVKIAVEKKVIKELAKLSDDMVLKSTTFVKNIQTELKKVDKTEAKNFLLGLRNEIDALLSKFGDGGTTEIYNIAEMNSSSSSVNPSKFARGGGVEYKIDFENFTIDEFKSFVKSINPYGDIEVSISVGNNVNTEGTYTKKIESKKIKDLSLSIGDAGREISVLTGSENIYADVLVYDNNYDKGFEEYTISLFSKDAKKDLKFVVNSIIEKFKRGGGVNANNNDVRVKALIKSLDNTPNSIGLAILRERLLTYTLNDLEVMKENPNAFGNFFISAGMYEDYFNRVFEELKFEYENGGEVGEFAKGGGVGKLPSNLQNRLNTANRLLVMSGGRELNIKEAIRWNIDNNSESGFVSGQKAIYLVGGDESNIKQKDYYIIGDALIDISTKMTGVTYDLYDFEIEKYLQGKGDKQTESQKETALKYAQNNKFADGGLIGNQKRIDLNENGKIDAEDFKLLRSSMNGAWRNDHKHVNSTSRNKKGKLIKHEIRYAKKNNPSRTGYKGKTNYARGGFVGKAELVWRKLSSSDRMNFLIENFTPEITPRSQEILVGKSYNFLPKKVKIVLASKYANVEEYAGGGGIEDSPRIYVADLEAYNDGRLNGEWLKLTDYNNADELMEAIQELLDKWGVEEYAIHDTEYIPSNLSSEYMGQRDFEQLYEMIDLANEYDLPLEVVQDVVSQFDASAVEEYIGKYDSAIDFAEQQVDETGIESFIDFQQYLDISNTDRRLLANDFADSYVDDIKNEDGGNRVIEEAGLDVSEYEEADSNRQDEMLDEAVEIVREEYYNTWYDGLDYPYYFLVEEQGLYSADDFAKANFVRIDYDKLADALEQDYTFIYDSNSDLYVFNIR